MRHLKAGRQLGRNAEHRLALMRNLTMALIQHERIITTVEKAKEVRPFVEAVDRTNLDAIHVFALDAVFSDDESHGFQWTLSNGADIVPCRRRAGESGRAPPGAAGHHA